MTIIFEDFNFSVQEGETINVTLELYRLSISLNPVVVVTYLDDTIKDVDFLPRQENFCLPHQEGVHPDNCHHLHLDCKRIR